MDQAILLSETTAIDGRRTHLNPFGNWCGHKPLSPNFYTPPEQHGYRPTVIQVAVEKLESFYHNPFSYLQSLLCSRASTRKERTEARERDAVVLGIILHHAELATMRVGTPLGHGTFLSLSMKDIALRAGWRTKEDNNNEKTKHRGIKRVWRSIRCLKKAGYITVHRRFKRKLEGEKDYIGLPAVRCISTKLFYELGVKAKELEKCRKQASTRLKKKYKALMKQAEAELKMRTKQTVGAITNAFNKNRNQRKNNKRERDAVREMEHRLRKKEYDLQKRLAELMKIPINQDKGRDALINEYPELKELLQIEKALQSA